MCNQPSGGGNRQRALQISSSSHTVVCIWASLVISGKESACDAGENGFNPWVGKIPWRGEWQPTPVFLPGKFHGKRSLVGYSPWACREADTAEQLDTH